MHVEQPKSRADILESLETIVRNSDHPLMDDGEILILDGGPGGSEAEVLLLRLRDGSEWALAPRCLRPGVPKERDYGDDPAVGDFAAQSAVAAERQHTVLLDLVTRAPGGGLTILPLDDALFIVPISSTTSDDLPKEPTVDVTETNKPKHLITIGNCNIAVEEVGPKAFRLRIRAASGNAQVLLLDVVAELDAKMATTLTVTPYRPDPDRGKFAMQPSANLAARVPQPPVPFMDL